MIMNSRQLHYAVKLSEILNFSQVADQLKISQPALSKQIMSLEQELGVRLFDRSTTPLRLTPAGESFIQGARELLYREDQLLRSMEDFQTGERGKLVIGISPFRSLYLIPKIVKKVKKKYPYIQVVLHETGSDQLRKDAAEGKYDFAIVNLPVDAAVLDVTPLEPDTLVLALPKNMLDMLTDESGKHPADLSIRDCKSLPFVVVGATQEMRLLFDSLCAAADFHPNITMEVVGLTTAWAMVRAGIGATLLPLQFIGSNDFGDNIVLLPLKDCLHTRQPAIVTRRGQYLPEYARYAMNLLTGKEK